MSAPPTPCWRATLCIGAEHPALAGHFPSEPLVPGVVLLDEVLHTLVPHADQWRVETVKFHHVVRPGESLQLQAQQREDGSYAFELRSAQGLVVSGLLLCRGAAAPDGAQSADAGAPG